MRRIIAFLLSILTVFSLLPVTALAASVDPAAETIPAVTVQAEETAPAETETTGETIPAETEAEESIPAESETSEEIIPTETQAAQEAPPAETEALEEPVADENGLVTVEFSYRPGVITIDGKELTSEDLFAGYVDRVLYEQDATLYSTGSQTAGARLSGDEAKAYKAISGIIKQLAEGRRSSTTIVLNPEYSADSQVTFTQSYKSFDTFLLFDALWSDLCYEMYWCRGGFDGSYRYYTSTNQLYEVQLQLMVDNQFRYNGQMYWLNTAKTSAAATAKANAKAIANKYAGKPAYDKLVGFRNEICNLNTYNDAAADNNNYSSWDYGPWQILYVFDKDPNTNVVCGGYAKAFQYLCDLSGVTCYYILGFMDGGYHAWNIVTLNGKNYLVDVTNSEPGTWGEDGSLFLAGGSGSVYSGYTFTNSYGSRITYTYERGDYDGTNMINTWGTSILTLSSSDYVPCTTHSYTNKITKAATCDSDGVRTYTCSKCGHSYTKSIPKVGHNYVGKVTREPVGSILAGIRTFTCTKCGSSYTKEFYYSQTVYRVAGSGRAETARRVASVIKSELRLYWFNAIIYTNGSNFADALAGSYLAAKKQAPILLYSKSAASQNLQYIRENLSPVGTVYILGGTTAVPQSEETALRNAGYKVQRLAGSDRYETNIKILKAAGFTGGEVLVCTGSNFADSLSASATGKPILLVSPKWTGLSSTYKSYLNSLSKSCTFHIIGGTSAVSDRMATALRSYGSVDRIYGSDRFQTSIAVAKRFFANPYRSVLAYSGNFPDGLCGGPLAYFTGAPLILVKTGKIGAAESYADSYDISHGYVLGTNELISDYSVKQIYNLANNVEITMK